jgi:hypothetical protein
VAAESLPRRVIERVAEQRILAAIEQGEFEQLPGTGKPIPGLDDPYDPDWWIKTWLTRNASLLAEKRSSLRGTFTAALLAGAETRGLLPR